MISGIFVVKDPRDKLHFFARKDGEEWSKEEFHNFCREIAEKREVGMREFVEILKKAGFIEIDPIKDFNGYFEWEELFYLS